MSDTAASELAYFGWLTSSDFLGEYRERYGEYSHEELIALLASQRGAIGSMRHRITDLGDAFDTLTARLAAVERERDAARRMVDAARTFRHDSRPGVYVDEVFDAIEVFHAVIDDYDALTAAATEAAK